MFRILPIRLLDEKLQILQINIGIPLQTAMLQQRFLILGFL